jgi:hypothetical protein
MLASDARIDIPLPKGWPRRVRSGAIHAIALDRMRLSVDVSALTSRSTFISTRAAETCRFSRSVAPPETTRSSRPPVDGVRKVCAQHPLRHADARAS